MATGTWVDVHLQQCTFQQSKTFYKRSKHAECEECGEEEKEKEKQE